MSTQIQAANKLILNGDEAFRNGYWTIAQISYLKAHALLLDYRLRFFKNNQRNDLVDQKIKYLQSQITSLSSKKQTKGKKTSDNL